MFVVSTLELLLIAAYSFIVPNYFVFLFSFSPLWANKEEAVDPPSNGLWRADARVFTPDTHLHFMTILLIYNKPNISSLSQVDTYPPFLPSLISPSLYDVEI